MMLQFQMHTTSICCFIFLSSAFCITKYLLDLFNIYIKVLNLTSSAKFVFSITNWFICLLLLNFLIFMNFVYNFYTSCFFLCSNDFDLYLSETVWKPPKVWFMLFEDGSCLDETDDFLTMLVLLLVCLLCNVLY